MRYILMLFILASCAAKENKIEKSVPSASIFDGSISKVLGCIFAPHECKKIEKEESLKQQEQITKELDELDKESK